MKKLFILFLFITLFLQTAFAINVREDSMGRPLYADDRIKVKLSEDASERLNSVLTEEGDYSNTGLDELDNVFKSISVSRINLAHRPVLDKIWEQENGFNRWYLLFVPIGTDIESTITNISRNEYIEHANPEHIFYLSVTPNDPYFDECWGHDNTAQLHSYNSGSGSHTGPVVGTVGFDSHIEEAWDDAQGYGNSSIIIAIIDTGVDYNHVDLNNNCVSGWDYGDGDSDPMDDSDDEGHGTCCAGIAAAEVNNSIGVSGVAGNCSIMPLKIANSSGSLLSSAVINALTHCGDNDVDVASM
ncbi:MAG: S8 family serine peptidase, partial [Candidatus Cloacimonetes bacterium]|nr:S8 family serine peptidase [Candidatus Cloacimonadota bacterium]